MIFGSNLSNFIAYVYHFVIGRLLSEAEYGELGAILSFMGLLGMIISFFGLVIVKFVSSEKESELKAVFAWFYNFGVKFGLVVSIIIFLTTPLMAKFLHIDVLTLILIGPIFFVSTLSLLFSSFLQGMLKFGKIIMAMNAQIVLRLVFGVLLVLVGFSVFGAVVGYFLSSLLTFIMLRSFVKEFRDSSVNNFFGKHKSVFFYAVPIFVSTFFTYALVSLDVIIVKHYFPASDAGVYTVLSTLGRIIFYSVAPISAVIFPIIARRASQGKEYRSIFKLSLVMSLIAVASILLFYWLLPSLVIGVLYGRDKYIDAYPLLSPMAIFVSLFALSSQIINYYLSLNITKVVIFLPVALLAQVAGFVLFHGDLISIIMVSIVVTGVLFLVLVGKLVYDKKV